MIQTPLAYKFVVSVAMVAFINHYAPRLNIPIHVPLNTQEIGKLKLMSPRCDNVMTLYGGGIRIDNYSFSFVDGALKDKALHFTGYFGITKLEKDGMSSFGIPMLNLNEPSDSLMERASRMKYAISTNDLYRIATNYLVGLEIDQNNFQNKNPLKIELEYFHSSRGWVPSPLMEVDWGDPKLRDPGSNGFAFLMSAVSGDLLEMNVGNATSCKGLPLIRDLDKLLAVTDEDFLKYSTYDRSNLVVQFAGLHLPDLYCPGIDDPKSTTNAISH